jgi:hypothetical protein
MRALCSSSAAGYVAVQTALTVMMTGLDGLAIVTRTSRLLVRAVRLWSAAETLAEATDQRHWKDLPAHLRPRARGGGVGDGLDHRVRPDGAAGVAEALEDADATARSGELVSLVRNGPS